MQVCITVVQTSAGSCMHNIATCKYYFPADIPSSMNLQVSTGAFFFPFVFAFFPLGNCPVGGVATRGVVGVGELPVGTSIQITKFTYIEGFHE